MRAPVIIILILVRMMEVVGMHMACVNVILLIMTVMDTVLKKIVMMMILMPMSLELSRYVLNMRYGAAVILMRVIMTPL